MNPVEIKSEDTVESLKAKVDQVVTEKYASHINTLVKAIHTANVKAGWYREVQLEGIDMESPFVKFFVGSKIALIHSEITEALEGYRKGLMDDHLPQRKMTEVELGDAVIRIFDLAGYLGFDLGGAIMDKLAYNSSRKDHKVENRDKENGKKF